MILKRIIPIFALSICFSLSPAAYADFSERSAEYEAWEQIAGDIADNYIDESVTKEEVMLRGISTLLENDNEMLVELLKSTLRSMDDYSDYYTAEEYEEYINSVNRTFSGIGVELRKTGQYAEIVGFTEDSLAEKAGFLTGDKIVKLDGVDVSERTLQEIKKLLMGEINSTINITVLRNGEYIDIIATRTEVKEETVIGEILSGNIGYARIASFGDRTDEEFESLYAEFEASNVKNIILDLRDNPGGLVISAVNVAKMIVPEGKIVDIKYRNSKFDMTYYSDVKDTDKKFVVLVNENTASAAEILASAIQDSGVGLLVGKRTYGKAVVQATYMLRNGSAYKLTTARYTTRNGNEINKVGLEPDFEIDNTTERIDTSLYTDMDYQNRYTLGASNETVKGAKERLYMLGIYKGTVDNGLFTIELQDAIKEYQYVNSLSASGVLDVVTQAKIQNTFSRLQKTVDNQLIEAYEILGGNPEDLES